jgi:hypothetical protein
MRLLIVPEGKNENGVDVDAVVCEVCLQTDYDVNEKHGFTDAEICSYIEALDLAKPGDCCHLCGVGSA